MIDTHCHIDDPQYEPDFDSFILSQQEGGVEAVVVPGVNALSVATVTAACRRYPRFLYPAAGLHPEEVKDDWQEQLSVIHDALFSPDAHFVGVGEIGLDYHFDLTWKTQQKQAFVMQLQWARELGLPVMIHSRDATEDCLDILRGFRGLRGVMHCFSGSHETAVEITRLGLFLGIGGVITFKNCRLADNLRGISLDSLVLETDAPYMAPVPWRGKRNESRWMSFVADKLAQVYNTSTGHICTATTANAKRLFGID